MKRFMLVLAVVMSLAGVANADLFTVGKTNVGGLDSFISAADLGNSGDKTELEWVKATLKRADITLDAKYDNKTPNWIWEETNEKGTFALHFLTDAPDYFVIKTASSSGFDHFLFQNSANLNWAVVKLAVGPEINIKNIGKFSHIDEFNVTSTPIPEPATILLLGFGLIGMAVFRKHSKKS